VEIFCDESGFTGNHLLDSEQQVFAYAAVAMESTLADDIISLLKKNHRLQGQELKGSVLIKQTRGRHAVTEALSAIKGHFRFAVHLKAYALASKLFEYIFEPAFSECNSIFYEIDFHRFISTILFVFFRAEDIETGKFLENFTAFARKGETSHLEMMFPPQSAMKRGMNPLHDIGTFAKVHRAKIAEEMLGFREPGVPNWLLDLTSTSLFNLLASWGQTYEALEVTCDEAKPLKGDLPLFDAMIGRREKATATFQGEEHPLTFNLSRSIKFGRSHEVSGLQLADIVAAAAATAWRASYQGQETEHTKLWRELLTEGMSPVISIWPELYNADIGNPEVFANTIVLHELIDRSLSGKELCKGMYQLYQFAVNAHPAYLKENSLSKSTDSAGREDA
jgi:hypothetical protein